MAAANWQTVAIQFVAETAFQILVAIPILGATVLLSVIVGADLGTLLQGGLRDIATRTAAALAAEPVALVSFARILLLVRLRGENKPSRRRVSRKNS